MTAFNGQNFGGRAATTAEESELAVLGCIFLDSDAADIAFSELTGKEFQNRQHRQAWQALRAAYDAGRDFFGDVDVLVDQLIRAGIDPNEAAVLAAAAMEQTPTSAHVSYYCGRLQALYQRAQLKALAERTTLSADDPAIDPGDTIERVLGDAEGLRAGIAAEGLISADAALVSFNERMELKRIATGLPDLDFALNGGVQPGQLVVVGARPSVGKSALMQQMLIHSAARGLPGLLISCEMTAAECAGRGIRQADRATFERLPLWISEASDLNRVVGQVRVAVRRHNISVVAVDYLQLIETKSERGTIREQQVAQISRTLKRLAVSLRIPVIVGSQLNRQAEDTGRPSLRQLRESGAIEQDADTVILLHRDGDDGDIEMIVAKHRNGRRGLVRTTFNGDRIRFERERNDAECFATVMP